MSTVACPSVAAATWTASSTAHASWLLIVKPTKRASADCASSVQEHLAGEVRHPLHADEDVGHRMRSLAGSNSGVASIEPTVTG